MDDNNTGGWGVSAELLTPDTVIPYSSVVSKAMGCTAENKAEANQTVWLDPPLEIEGLKILADQSTILPQCCTAYGDNIAGFGLSVEYIDDISGKEEDQNPAAVKEWNTIENVLKTLSVECDVSDVFSEAIKERERCGIAYIEAIRDFEGNVVEILNLIDTETVRKSKADDVETPYTFYVDGEATVRRKRFRKYRQEVNGKTVYFKEFMDPRTMDWRTGEYVSDDLDMRYKANELFELKIGNEHYGKVRWCGQILCIDGSHAAEVLNCSYFHNGRHTPMMILVTGGKLSQESRTELQHYLNAVRGEKGQHAFLLMEVKPEKGKTAFDEEKEPRVEIKDLGPMLQTDALFGKYLDDNRRKVQSAFRLPDIYVAYTTSYNKATAYAAMKVTEQQVFEKERKSLEWKICNQLLNSYGFKYVKAVFNAPAMTDDDVILQFVSLYARYGGLTPNKAKEKLYATLGDAPSENYDEKWGDIPLAVLSRNGSLQNEPAHGSEPDEQAAEEADEASGKEASVTEKLDEQIEKASRDGAADETLYVLRETRRLLMQLAANQGVSAE